MTKEKYNKSNLVAAIETILFVHGEPLSISKIAKILKKDAAFKNLAEEEIKTAIGEMESGLLADNRGLTLIESGEGGRKEFQLAAKPEFGTMLENFIKEEFKESLSPASLETLALIAYLGPLTRAQIDYYRGVNSTFILRSLMVRGLIDRSPDPHRKNVYLYQPSFDLLKYLGIAKVHDLPEYEKIKFNQQLTTNN